MDRFNRTTQKTVFGKEVLIAKDYNIDRQSAFLYGMILHGITLDNTFFYLEQVLHIPFDKEDLTNNFMLHKDEPYVFVQYVVDGTIANYLYKTAIDNKELPITLSEVIDIILYRHTLPNYFDHFHDSLDNLLHIQNII